MKKLNLDNSRGIYYIMSLNEPVAEIEIRVGGNAELIKVINTNLLPTGVKESGVIRWYAGRRIPASRKNLENLEYRFGNIEELLIKSMALSLSDSYWVRPANLDIVWEEVNFFDNNFTDNVGEFLLEETEEVLSVHSPQNTTDGVFPKKWITLDGKRFLVKQGSSKTLDHLNEILASKILKVLTENTGVTYTDYTKHSDKCCKCECFIEPGQNLVPVLDYLKALLPYVTAKENPTYYAILCKPLVESG